MEIFVFLWLDFGIGGMIVLFGHYYILQLLATVLNFTCDVSITVTAAWWKIFPPTFLVFQLAILVFTLKKYAINKLYWCFPNICNQLQDLKLLTVQLIPWLQLRVAKLTFHVTSPQVQAPGTVCTLSFGTGRTLELQYTVMTPEQVKNCWQYDN